MQEHLHSAPTEGAEKSKPISAEALMSSAGEALGSSSNLAGEVESGSPLRKYHEFKVYQRRSRLDTSAKVYPPTSAGELRPSNPLKVYQRRSKSTVVKLQTIYEDVNEVPPSSPLESGELCLRGSDRALTKPTNRSKSTVVQVQTIYEDVEEVPPSTPSESAELGFRRSNRIRNKSKKYYH